MLIVCALENYPSKPLEGVNMPSANELFEGRCLKTAVLDVKLIENKALEKPMFFLRAGEIKCLFSGMEMDGKTNISVFLIHYIHLCANTLIPFFYLHQFVMLYAILCEHLFSV